VKGYVLLSREHVEHGSLDPGETIKVSHGRRINVDASEATEFGLHITDSRLTFVEALSAATQACK
jgi:hypothetical protein